MNTHTRAGMKCPTCNGGTKVYNSRELGGVTWRQRECLKCLNRFITNEAIVADKVMPQAIAKRYNDLYHKKGKHDPSAD